MTQPTPNELLLKAIRERGGAGEHNYGILTGDSYAKTLLDCTGTDLCYRYGATKSESFDDALKRASRTLTYNSPDMKLEQVVDKTDLPKDINGETLEIPKNTLLLFRHILTTPRKDRDGDILRTQGAKPDPKMPLLWQHVHTLPIGKVLGIAEHNSKKLSLYTAVVDINALSQDAAVMIENKMGRFSHGFRAIEFEEVKADPNQGKPTGAGFDVKKFEVLEASLVSVPSNVDAETEEILLSLVEGGKLTSPLLKGVGRTIREKQTRQVIPVSIDITTTINGKTVGEPDANVTATKGTTGKTGCQCGGNAPSEEADGDAQDKGQAGDTKAATWNHQVTVKTTGDAGESLKGMLELISKVCGVGHSFYVDVDPDMGDDKDFGDAADRRFTFDGDGADKLGEITVENLKEDKAEPDEKAAVGEKAGKVLSQRNYKALKDVVEDLDEIEKNCSTRSGKALCTNCRRKVIDVIKTAGYEDETSAGEITVKQAAAVILAKASPEERRNLVGVLAALNATETQADKTKQFRAFMAQN